MICSRKTFHSGIIYNNSTSSSSYTIRHGLGIFRTSKGAVSQDCNPFIINIYQFWTFNFVYDNKPNPQKSFFQSQKSFNDDIASTLLQYNDSSGASSPPGCLSSSNSTTSTSSGVSCLSPNSQQNFSPSFNFFGKINPPFEATKADQIKSVKEEPLFDMPRKKSKKGPAPKLFGNERCKICDSRATGFHYNVLSCEACKVSTKLPFNVGQNHITSFGSEFLRRFDPKWVLDHTVMIYTQRYFNRSGDYPFNPG